MNVTVTPLGAAGTVTGSKYLVESGDTRVLIDCGLFQGERRWREKNWRDPEVDLSSISALLLTHGHIDHTGLLPRYVAKGLTAPLFATRGTCDLCTILLPDSGRLQEEEASFRSEKGRSRHHPPQPLYNEAEARKALEQFVPVDLNKEYEVAEGVNAEWRQAGHILGAASITLTVNGHGITFSGDLGRYNDPVLQDPASGQIQPTLFIESTYGDEAHTKEDPKEKLAEVVSATVKRGGMVLIPAFAVGRTQLILYYLRELKEEKRIPNIPVIVDSPMATDATSLYRDHTESYNEHTADLFREGKRPFSPERLHFTRSRTESIELNSVTDPMVIISASGMLSGGRILHHLLHRISSPLTTLCFAGFQAPGGRGSWLQQGAKKMRLFGQEVAVNAQIETIPGLSAHAGQHELLRWCREAEGRPERVFITHGEPDAARALQSKLEEEFSWKCHVPQYLEKLFLD